jgi:hypothetical protein
MGKKSCGQMRAFGQVKPRGKRCAAVALEGDTFGGHEESLDVQKEFRVA